MRFQKRVIRRRALAKVFSFQSIMVTLEELKVITDPKEYRANGVKYHYTVKNAKTDKLIKATNYKQNLHLSWQKYVKTMDW